MKLFTLPDLGEGLPDAQIREWYVKEGDTVKIDQPLVAMETAKALVDVPSPYEGIIEKLFGAAGDTIHTNAPLVGFSGLDETETSTRKDTGTVVGTIEVSDTLLTDDAVAFVQSDEIASPAVRALARQQGIDLGAIRHQHNRVRMHDLKSALKTQRPLPEGFVTFSPTRRAMIISMEQSHTEIVPVTITEDADVHSWYGKDNITIRIIRAITTACEAEPMLNAHFDRKHVAYRLHKAVNIGLAVDTPHGLYVPVLRDVAQQSDEALRLNVNNYKEQAKNKSINQEDLRGATIMLSNFGTIVGRYATPIILPPMTAIIGIGKLRDAVVPHHQQIAVHKIIPVSLTVDHRAITGGEAARFLQTLIAQLELPTTA